MTDGPVCGAMGIILQAQETSCARPPHKHGDHQNWAGDRWPSFEGEYDEMLILTLDHMRELLASGAQDPVLYVACDEDTGEAVRLEVGPEAHAARQDDIVVRQHELVDALGGPNHPDGVTDDALEHLKEGYQDEICAIEISREVPDADPSEPDGVYDGEIR